MKGNGVINITEKRAMKEAQTILVCAIIFAIVFLLAVCAYADDLNPTLLKHNKLSEIKKGELAELQRVVAMKNDQIKSERKGPMMSILPLDLDELVKMDRPRVLAGGATIDLEFELDSEGNITSITFSDAAIPEVSVNINNKGDVTVQYSMTAYEDVVSEKQISEFAEKMQILLEEGSRDKELVKNYDKNYDGVFDYTDINLVREELAAKDYEDLENGFDINQDGIFDAKDLEMMHWAMAEKAYEELTDYKADLNGDGLIDDEDAEERGDDIETGRYSIASAPSSGSGRYEKFDTDADGQVLYAGGGKTLIFRAAESSEEPGKTKVLGEEQIRDGVTMDFAGIRDAFEEFMEKMNKLDEKKRRLKRKVEMFESFEGTAAELAEGRRESSVAIDIKLQMFGEEEREARKTLGAKLVAATGMSDVRTDSDTAYIGLGLPAREYAEAEE